MRQKKHVCPRKTDLEIFSELHVQDLWEDACLEEAYIYIYIFVVVQKNMSQVHGRLQWHLSIQSLLPWGIKSEPRGCIENSLLAHCHTREGFLITKMVY